jgi:hypothetical protein
MAERGRPARAAERIAQLLPRSADKQGLTASTDIGVRGPLIEESVRERPAIDAVVSNSPMKAEDLHRLEHRVREVPEALEEFGPDYAVEL